MPTIHIEGMRCQHCVASVTQALSAIDGISNVQVDLENKQATYDTDRDIPLATIKTAISATGFEVTD